MKFGKNLSLVVEISDPEWAPFWMNYKFLKKKINDIVQIQCGVKVDQNLAKKSDEIAKSQCEREFFQLVRKELKKTSDFFAASEDIYSVRQNRVKEGYLMLKQGLENQQLFDKGSWTMLLSACTKLYRDVLLLQNFAIMNFIGFSKILKKHDKLTGFSTRAAFMRNVMSRQNFAHYPFVIKCIQEVEKLFADIQAMESTIGLHAEEKLFIEALRGLNKEAFKLQEEEKLVMPLQTKENENSANPHNEALSSLVTVAKSSMLFPSDSAQSTDLTMTELSSATALAIDAATKMAQSIQTNTNIQEALQWMEAIRRKDPETNLSASAEAVSGNHTVEYAVDKFDSVGSGTDIEDADNLTVGRKRKAQTEVPLEA